MSIEPMILRHGPTGIDGCRRRSLGLRFPRYLHLMGRRGKMLLNARLGGCRSHWQTLTGDSHDGPGERPLLDLSTLIGLSPDDAVAVATDAGFQDVRVLEFVDDELIGAMDMSLRPNRLNLEIENWRVRRAVFGS